MARPYKILFIFGTRPEAIKLAPVIKEAERDASFEVETCVTAQHREMLDQTLEVFAISETDFSETEDGEQRTERWMASCLSVLCSLATGACR